TSWTARTRTPRSSRASGPTRPGSPACTSRTSRRSTSRCSPRSSGAPSARSTTRARSPRRGSVLEDGREGALAEGAVRGVVVRVREQVRREGQRPGVRTDPQGLVGYERLDESLEAGSVLAREEVPRDGQVDGRISCSQVPEVDDGGERAVLG